MTRGHLSLTRVQTARLVQASLALALFFVSTSGRAQPSPRAGLGLNWVRLAGADSCIASIDLMNRIERRLGRIIFVRTGEAVLTIDGYVQPAPNAIEQPAGWLVTFEISDAQGKVLGRRALDRLEGSDCAVVASATELIVELTLDPDGLLGAGIPLEPATQALLDELLRGEPSELDPSTLPMRKEASPPKAPKKIVGKAPPAPAADPASPTVDDRVHLDVTGVGMLGSMPALAAGGAVNLSIELRPAWSLELGFLALTSQTVQAARRDAGTASFGYQTLSLALCRHVSWIELCGGAEYGRQTVSASGFETPLGVLTRELLNLRLHATFRLELFAGFYLRASTAAVLPMLRQDYVYDSREGDIRLFRTGLVLGRAELGLGLHI